MKKVIAKIEEILKLTNSLNSLIEDENIHAIPKAVAICAICRALKMKSLELNNESNKGELIIPQRKSFEEIISGVRK